MGEIKLGKLIVLADGRRYCITNQVQIGLNHYSSAVTVPREDESIEEIRNARLLILHSVMLPDGKVGTCELPETKTDYKKILGLLSRMC